MIKSITNIFLPNSIIKHFLSVNTPTAYSAEQYDRPQSRYLQIREQTRPMSTFLSQVLIGFMPVELIFVISSCKTLSILNNPMRLNISLT